MAIGTTALLAAGAGFAGAVASSRASGRAVDAQTDAAEGQIALSRETYANQAARFAPYEEAGQEALGQYTNALAGGPQTTDFYQRTFAPQRGPSQYDQVFGTGPYEQSDRYQFLQRQAQRGIDGSAAAQNNLLSSATMDRQQENAFGLAAQDYGNWQNGQLQRIAGNTQERRYRDAGRERGLAFNTDQTNLFNSQLGSLANMGQSSAAMTANAAGAMGQQGINALGSIGNAQSAGAVAQGNAFTNGIQNGLSTFGYLNQTGGLGSGGLFGPNAWS